jgi:hypothetical protein
MTAVASLDALDRVFVRTLFATRVRTAYHCGIVILT